MVFNSFTFAIFFALVVLLHYLPFSWRVRKFNLVWASYLFYAAWNPPFVVLLWISTLVDWVTARRIHAAASKRGRRLWLFVSLGANLGMLGFFKYGAFLLANFTWLMRTAGIEYVPPEMDIVLPVGISFYTFQTLSYTLDVYFGRMRPWNSFLDYALYVTFFPQLVAGPILRAESFLEQCEKPRRATFDEFSWGIFLMTVGLFQKVVLADGLLAPIVEKTYDTWFAPDTLSAWCGTAAFSGQIFCDFAGYSSCAIGAALCLGFVVPSNFKYPYAAVGFSDFWRRWHISLSTWLRDYLYIPLGGNRRGNVRTYVNLMLTMLLGGLWHGASWTFVIWGGIHGLYLAVERALRDAIPNRAFMNHLLARTGVRLVTYGLVCVAWVFFRAKSLPGAFAMCASLFGAQAETAQALLDGWDTRVVFWTMTGLIGYHWFMADRRLESVARRAPSWSMALAISAMLFLIFTMPGEDRAFIYFQF